MMTRRSFLIVTVAWLAIVSLGFAGLLYFIQEEQARDERQWQKQMQISSYAVKTNIEQWIGTQRKAIDMLAENEALRLYLMELSAQHHASTVAQNATNAESSGAVQPPQYEVMNEEERLALSAYLRNLLVSESTRSGFSAPAGEEIGANIKPQIAGGLALYDSQRALISSTADFPVLSDLPTDVQEKLFSQESPLVPFVFFDRSYVVFSAPIYAIQASENASPTGYVLGMRQLDRAFQAVMTPSAEAVDSTESYIVRPNGESLSYASPLLYARMPHALSTRMSDSQSAEIKAVKQSGRMMVGADYVGRTSLAVARPIVGTDWYVIHKVNEAIALTDTHARRDMFIAGYLLVAGLFTVIAIAFWRNAVAAETNDMVNRYKEIAQKNKRERDSQFVHAQRSEKHQRVLSDLINTLIASVDKRDPRTQGHSECVAYIAQELAVDMGLSEDEVRTTALAGRLMNVGKIKMPESILLDATQSESKKKHIREAIRSSADMLAKVPFDIPVVDTLKQVSEHMDGTGPLGLKSESILVPAKILAVVNAFVAMTSERPYRTAMTPSQAMEAIMASADKTYYRPACEALKNYLRQEKKLKIIQNIREQQPYVVV